MRICFVASPKALAQQAREALVTRYGQCCAQDADCIVAVGGDRTILKALQIALAGGRQAVFGMRTKGSVGALANSYAVEDLLHRLQNAQRIVLHPLKAEPTTNKGPGQPVFAINEVVLSRQVLQTTRICVCIEGHTYPTVVGDGLIVSTAIGSGGYNRSAGGSALAYDAPMLALTAIASDARSKWRNTTLADCAVIDITVASPEFRPVRLETSDLELRDLRCVRITSCRDVRLPLLIDRTVGSKAPD
jgi:NAD+ kinase